MIKRVKVLTGALYTLLVVCMGIATVVEKFEGTEFVGSEIYGSWWFMSLWALLTVVALCCMCKLRLYRRLPVFALHLSFVVILSGALATHLTAERGTVHLHVNENVRAFDRKDGSPANFPFTIALTHFDVINYPGTEAPMDYICTLRIIGRDAGEEVVRVSMNHIGKVQGYRFYQSSFDSDHLGTHLLVVHDPYGIAITYFGYLLLFVSFLMTMFSRHTHIRFLYQTSLKRAVAVALLFMPLAMKVQSKIIPVSPEIAHEMGRVAVLFNGRICPLNTVATEFVTKLCGKSSWQGYSADEIFFGWMIYYSDWETQKIIKVKNADVQRILGITDKWASVADFYTAGKSYKLAGLSNDTSLSESTRKAVRETDEKIQVVTMFYNNEMLRLFPLSTDGKLAWYTPGSTELPLGTPAKEFQFINHAMDYLVKSVLVDDVEEARMLISKIRLYQREKAGSLIPSPAKVNAELLYNTLQNSNWMVYLFLALSLLFCLFQFSESRAATNRMYHWLSTFCIFAMFIYLTMLLSLRGYVGGHVPLSNGYETMLFLAWSTILVTVLLMRRIFVLKAFGPLIASFCMLVAVIAVGNPQITPLMPVLQSPLLSVHVVLVMLSYAMFAIITLLSAKCLIMKDKYECEQLTALSQLLLYPSVLFLTFGIFIGAIWANISWGSYWSWDPKETWALITLMIYAVPLHKSFLPNVSDSSPHAQGRRIYHFYMIFAFLMVLMTYFGVNYLLPGMHSYA